MRRADATIVRTSWVCGFHGANMVKTILRVAAQHGAAALRGRPASATRPSPTTWPPCWCAWPSTGGPGIFHVTNQGAVSWYEFVRPILAAAGDDPDRVEPITTAELQPPRPAPRPANSVLDNAALRLCDITPLEDFRVPLQRLVDALRAE